MNARRRALLKSERRAERKRKMVAKSVSPINVRTTIDIRDYIVYNIYGLYIVEPWWDKGS